jgi:hypothetical protein
VKVADCEPCPTASSREGRSFPHRERPPVRSRGQDAAYARVRAVAKTAGEPEAAAREER